MKTHLLKMKLMACIMILLPAFSFGRNCYKFDNFGKLCIGNYITATKTRRFTTGQKAGGEIFVKGQKGVVKKIEERWPGKWVVHVKWDGSQDTKWLTPSAADLAKIGSSGNRVGRNCKKFENFGKLCVGDKVLATSTRKVNGKVKFKKDDVGVVTKIARNSAGTEVPYVKWRGSQTAEWLTPRSTDWMKLTRCGITLCVRKNLRSRN